MKKVYLTIFLSLLFAPGLTFAATGDVTLSGSTIITVGGYSLTVSDSAGFDSITVNADNFTIDMSKGSSLVVTSTDKRKFTVSPDQYKKSFVCGSSQSTLTLEQNIWDTTVTVTITPSTDACSVSGSSAGASTGGSSGGGGVPTPVYTVTPGTTVTATTPTVTTPTVTTPVIGMVATSFKNTLKAGMKNADIKRLQQLLNSDPDTMIASSGVGSPGNETEYFGGLTSEAVKKFQAKYGIVSSGTAETTGYGLVGPSTRAKLNEVFSGTTTVTTPQAPQVGGQATGISATFTSGMAIGMESADIKRLQQLLNSDPDTMIASSGVGSPGNETEYFGSLTEKAIQKFQMKHGVVSSVSDVGYGYVGPKTRAKLNEVFSSVGASVSTTPTVPTTPIQTITEAQLEVQIQSLLQQLEALQAELNTM
ncbi:MAG: peptidoglycan-binding protein [Patescibacteria group bacterium]